MKKIFLLSAFSVFSIFLFAQTTIQIGSETYVNTTSGFPAPYGNYYNGAKHQFLILASEITNEGVTQGFLTQLGFNVSRVQGTALNNFTIRIKETSDTYTSTAFDTTGLTTVFSQTYTETSGWNMHAFDSPFYWDGSSNLLIEVCFNNLSDTYSAGTYYSNTSFYSSTYYGENSNVACDALYGSRSAYRPTMQLSFQDCSGSSPAVDAGNDTTICAGASVSLGGSPTASGGTSPYTYSWSPAGSLNDATVANPSATPSASTEYFLEVWDDGFCVAYDTVIVNVSGSVTASSMKDTICVGDSTQLFASAAGGGAANCFSDDFESGIDNSKWTVVGGATGNSCGVASGSYALYFNGSGERTATTKTLNTVGGGDVTFSLIIGSSSFGSCENADFGEDIVLEYSLDGTNWAIINTYYTSGYSTFTTITETIPSAAETSNTQFRWRQVSFSSNLDNWSIDDVSLDCNSSGNDSYTYNWTPSSSLTDPAIYNPIAFPSSATTYYVSVTDTVTNCTDTDSVIIYPVNLPNPTASFTVSDDTTCEYTYIYFTNTSSDAISYEWDFGDGSTSTLTSPNKYYSSTGTYTVTLTAYNDCGSSDTYSADIVVEGGSVNSYFYASTTYGCEPLTVNFTNSGSTSATDFSWDFGDGNSSTQENPSHTYNEDGTYYAVLTASNSCDWDTYTRTITVQSNDDPEADIGLWNLSDTIICTGSYINPENYTQNADSYYWDFGNGSTSYYENPNSVYYSSSGTYTIIMQASNSCSNTTDSDTITIKVLDFVTADATFTADVTEGCAPSLDVEFTPNDTVNFASFYWDFDDGTTSDKAVPQHDFTNSSTSATQTYTVTLTTTNCAYTSATESEDIDVYVNPTAEFLASDTELTLPDSTVQFAYTGEGGSTYFWDFGDGTTSTATSPSHSYNTTGEYTVTLIVHDVTNTCRDIMIKPSYIKVKGSVGIGDMENDGLTMNAYPNPFKNETMVTYTLTERSNVKIDLLDIRGKTISNLLNNVQPAGVKQKIMISADELNLANGIYLLRLNT